MVTRPDGCPGQGAPDGADGVHGRGRCDRRRGSVLTISALVACQMTERAGRAARESRNPYRTLTVRLVFSAMTRAPRRGPWAPPMPSASGSRGPAPARPGTSRRGGRWRVYQDRSLTCRDCEGVFSGRASRPSMPARVWSTIRSAARRVAPRPSARNNEGPREFHAAVCGACGVRPSCRSRHGTIGRCIAVVLRQSPCWHVGHACAR